MTTEQTAKKDGGIEGNKAQAPATGGFRKAFQEFIDAEPDDQVSTGTDDNNKSENHHAAHKGHKIKGNTFYKILHDKMLTRDEKIAAVAAALKDPQLQQEFEVFSKYLQSKLISASDKLMSLTDADSFSKLHYTYTKMHNEMKEIDNNLKPLTDILEAIQRLRQEGKDPAADADLVERVSSPKLKKQKKHLVVAAESFVESAESQAKALLADLHKTGKRIDTFLAANAEFVDTYNLLVLAAAKAARSAKVSNDNVTALKQTASELLAQRSTLTRMKNTNGELEAKAKETARSGVDSVSEAMNTALASVEFNEASLKTGKHHGKTAAKKKVQHAAKPPQPGV